jgi:hypothetical protein
VAVLINSLLEETEGNLPNTRVVYIDVEKVLLPSVDSFKPNSYFQGDIKISPDPLTFYWRSHQDPELLIYCSNAEFLLEQQRLLAQQTGTLPGTTP